MLAHDSLDRAAGAVGLPAREPAGRIVEVEQVVGVEPLLHPLELRVLLPGRQAHDERENVPALLRKIRLKKKNGRKNVKSARYRPILSAGRRR